MMNFSRPLLVLTGATGALGSAIISRLLQTYPNADLLAIVRGKSDEEARQRLAQAIDMPAFWQSQQHRIHVLTGDVSQPDLGMTPEQAQAVSQHCWKLFHFAANVRFSASLEESIAGNIDCTRTTLAFADRCMAANPTFELHYASTAYVSGNRHDAVLEDDLDCGQSFSNPYEQTKLAAEIMVTQARERMPVTIYRPSQVLCLSADGKVRKLFGFLEFLKLACSKKAIIPCLPANPQVRTDMVPIDYVCDAIAWLSQDAESQGKNHLLAAGTARSLPMEIVAEIALSKIRSHAGAAAAPVLEYVSDQEFQARAEAGNIHPGLVALLSIYQTYLSWDRDFRTGCTDARLERAGIRLPDMEQILRQAVNYVVEQYYPLPKAA